MQIIGRERETALIRSHFESHSTLVVCGPSGIGKSTLAHHYINRHARSGLSIDCTSRNAFEIATSILDALETSPISRHGSDVLLEASLALKVAEVDTLLLDDCLADLSELKILQAKWEGDILVTSLISQEESVLTLGGIKEAAGELLLYAAKFSSIGFELDDSDTEAVNEILRLLDGHSLGLTLAGRLWMSSSSAACLPKPDGSRTFLKHLRFGRKFGRSLQLSA